MIHVIKNARLQIQVNTVGAELCSLKSLSSGTEYMWEGKPENLEKPFAGFVPHSRRTQRRYLFVLKVNHINFPDMDLSAIMKRLNCADHQNIH